MRGDCPSIEISAPTSGKRQGKLNSESTWVFGYGSLCWNPGFKYSRALVGYIEHHAIRFWQGNTTHRGTPKQPARVATLVESKGEITYGVAFELSPSEEESTLQYLEHREITLGGYRRFSTTFFPLHSDNQLSDTTADGDCISHGCSSDVCKSPLSSDGGALPACDFPHRLHVLVYVATPQSRHWLGSAPLSEIADHVLRCRGPSGHNVEYVLRLAAWVHRSLPPAVAADNYVTRLEQHILRQAAAADVCLHSLAGAQSVSSGCAVKVDHHNGRDGQMGAVRGDRAFRSPKTETSHSADLSDRNSEQPSESSKVSQIRVLS